jgi:hypothetical protein
MTTVSLSWKLRAQKAESELAALREQRLEIKKCGVIIGSDELTNQRAKTAEANLAASERQCNLEVACRQSAEHALREQVRLREASERIAEGLAQQLTVVCHRLAILGGDVREAESVLARYQAQKGKP